MSYITVKKAEETGCRLTIEEEIPKLWCQISHQGSCELLYEKETANSCKSRSQPVQVNSYHLR